MGPVLSELLQLVEQELRKRYGVDYEVIYEPSAAEALSKLEALKDADQKVALLFTGQSLPEMTGIQFLDQAHDLHPSAHRILLHDRWERGDSETVLQALTFGRIDSYLERPAGVFDERFHSQITDLLETWRRQTAASGFHLRRAGLSVPPGGA